MLKFGSKNDVTVVHRATIRLLDDTEIIQCDFQVRGKKEKKSISLCHGFFFSIPYLVAIASGDTFKAIPSKN